MSSRVGRRPIEVPAGVDIRINESAVAIKGKMGELTLVLAKGVVVKHEDQQMLITTKRNLVNGDALAGTTRAILSNHVKGVTEGFAKKLQLVGVGYRAQVATAHGKSVL